MRKKRSRYDKQNSFEDDVSVLASFGGGFLKFEFENTENFKKMGENEKLLLGKKGNFDFEDGFRIKKRSRHLEYHT